MNTPAVYLTARDSGSRLAKTQLAANPCQHADIRQLRAVSVDERVAYQTIEGFGGAFTEAASTTLDKLPADRREEVLRAYFDPADGHAYSLCRTHINSCDFALGNYAYCERDGDHALATFTIERDRRSLLPMIQDALRVSGNGFRLFASPWSPPAWMKTNGEMNRGGQLKPDCRQTWADYFVRYIREYEKEGVNIWGVTVQNEPLAVQPWDSCVYSAEETRDFVRDYLGPTFAANGLAGCKIIVWDHNREKIYAYAKPILSDPDAARYVWGTGFHWYCGNQFESIQRMHEAWPDKHLLFTEGCQEGGPHHGSWLAAERYGESVIQDLNHWTVGWVDWNMVLDERGGPNHVGNFCHAPILVDTARGEILYQPSYHYLGHFSRFIRPGARRVLATSGHDELETTAALNPDSTLAIVIMNRSEQPLNFTLDTTRGTHLHHAPRRSIQTVVL